MQDSLVLLGFDAFSQFSSTDLDIMRYQEAIANVKEVKTTTAENNIRSFTSDIETNAKPNDDNRPSMLLKEKHEGKLSEFANLKPVSEPLIPFLNFIAEQSKVTTSSIQNSESNVAAVKTIVDKPIQNPSGIAATPINAAHNLDKKEAVTISDEYVHVGNSFPTGAVQHKHLPSSTGFIPKAQKVPLFSIQKHPDIGGNVNWTPLHKPLPPLPGFTPIPNHGIRLETPIHEWNIWDCINWTPIVNSEDRFKLPGFKIPDLEGLDMNTFYNKAYLPSVEDIAGRKPINGDLAGQKFPLEEKFPELHAKYGDIYFKLNGCPDFTPVTRIQVEIDDLIGDHYHDFKKANEAAGISELPKGYTWHHVEDGRTMQMVPSKLHYAVKHTGGGAKQKYESKQ